jgi:serine/threonine-protein kinase
VIAIAGNDAAIAPPALMSAPRARNTVLRQTDDEPIDRRRARDRAGDSHHHVCAGRHVRPLDRGRDTQPHHDPSCYGVLLLYYRSEMERTIGQYRVTGLIGQGGMGAVYAGEHTLLGRPAAIKVLLPELSQKQDVVLRFFNEARAATAIRHPGIIEIYDFGWTPEGAAFIVMEHLEGETLGRRASRARLRWQSVLAIARQIAGALAAAHGKGIVHRDLKPDNVFLVPDPEVPGGERIKLLDFGIAKLAGESSPAVNVTKTGSVMGTPTYMAPEQCRGVAVDHRVDLYALGCIVFELCTGRPPFVGEGTGDVLAAHIHVPVPRLATLGTEVPPPVEALIQRLLAKSPSQRVQSAEDLIRAIDAITTERAHSMSDVSSGAHPTPASAMVTTLSGATSTSRQMPAFAARRGRLITIVSAAAVMIVGFVIVAALRGRSDDASRVVSYSTLAHPAGAERSPAEPATPGSPAPSPVEPPPQQAAPPTPSRGEPSTPPAPPEPSPVAPVTPPPPVIAPQEPPPATPRQPPERVDVTVESVPSGAQVMLAGTVLGKTPFHGTLPHRNGDVTLLVRLAGYVDRSVVVHGGQPINERVKLVLVKVAPPRPPRGNRDQSVNPFGN